MSQMIIFVLLYVYPKNHHVYPCLPQGFLFFFVVNFFVSLVICQPSWTILTIINILHDLANDNPRIFVMRYTGGTKMAKKVTRTSKAMQTTAIRTVANSLPQNEVILLTLLISTGYIPYTNLLKMGEKMQFSAGNLALRWSKRSRFTQNG